MNQTQRVKNAAKKLGSFTETKHAIVGFDGFVDEIIHVVDKRKNHEEYERISDIKAFSERIAAVAGLSANIELVPTQTKLGGNGPIMANAMIAQGQEITYIGALGEEQIDTVFIPFAESCREVVSLTDPGHTDALEFHDGKIMMGKMNNLIDVNLENLLKKKSEKELITLLSETELVAFTNWTMLAGLNSIIEKFGEIISKLDNKPTVFFDLADPKKRTNEDISDVLKLIAGMPCDKILGMNLSESSIIAQVLNIEEEDVLERAVKIREKSDITGIVIHPLNGAAVAHEKEAVWIDGPYTKKPILTTGAGDNFNAGFCNGWLGGLEPGECLLMGVCTSGFYVRNAKSPSRKELTTFMTDWASNNCENI